MSAIGFPPKEVTPEYAKSVAAPQVADTDILAKAAADATAKADAAKASAVSTAAADATAKAAAAQSSAATDATTKANAAQVAAAAYTDAQVAGAGGRVVPSLSNPLNLSGDSDKYVPLTANADITLPLATRVGQTVVIVTKAGLIASSVDALPSQFIRDTGDNALGGDPTAPVALSAGSRYELVYVGSNIWHIFYNAVTSP